MATRDLTVALAGNPNSGKTTIFNNITGARQHVGNYPGVTVEKREGFRHFQDKDFLIVDLPGTYSLTAHALDELVARNVILNDRPDIIVNILDASNLERNLYLTIQLLELERPVVLALNMADMSEKMGQKIDDQALSHKLGAMVVRTIGNRNRGIDSLLKAVVHTAETRNKSSFSLDYGPEIETKITQVMEAIQELTEIQYPARWLAVKLLEDDQEVISAVRSISGGEKILAVADRARAVLKNIFNEEIKVVFAERRYHFVSEIYRQVVVNRNELAQTTSDKLDRILTNRILGLPIFFAIMWLLFNLVFTLGAYPQDWLNNGVAWLSDLISAHLADGDLKSLVVDGIIGGVGTVISFLPQILLLFLGIALLEDTGYMARAAFVMDRAMRAIGLHGKAFIPLLLGFGCNIPAIMGARTLENPQDRLVTIMVAPLMSCSARLPIYTLLTAAFFSESYAGTVLFSLYFLGIVLAIIMAWIFRKFLFPGESEPFAMEMPLYHIPTMRSILTHMWERSALYLKKAGTIILAVSILVWFFISYPSDVSYSKNFEQIKANTEESFQTAVTEKVLEPLQLEKVEDSRDLSALISQISDIKEAKDADKEAGQTEAAVDSEDSADLPDDPKLIELQQVNPEIYPYAIQYWTLDSERKAEVEKLDEEEAAEKLAGSYAGRFGHLIEPAIQPLGFDWKMGVSLFAGFTAKEVVVSTMGTLYSMGKVEDDTTELQTALVEDPAFSPLVAYVLMVFSLIYTPCVAAMAVVRRETNSWKWTAFTITYSVALAWIVSFGVYRIGLLLGY
ncbi:MAG: der 3 [Firmicutes bacterium]|nr:der 3 [Bacillota bacterium]